MNDMTERALERASVEGKCDLEGRKDPPACDQVDGQREVGGGSRAKLLPRFVWSQVDDFVDRRVIRIALVDVRTGEVLDCDLIDRDLIAYGRSDELAKRVGKFRDSLFKNGVMG